MKEKDSGKDFLLQDLYLVEKHENNDVSQVRQAIHLAAVDTFNIAPKSSAAREHEEITLLFYNGDKKTFICDTYESSEMVELSATLKKVKSDGQNTVDWSYEKDDVWRELLYRDQHFAPTLFVSNMLLAAAIVMCVSVGLFGYFNQQEITTGIGVGFLLLALYSYSAAWRRREASNKMPVWERHGYLNQSEMDFVVSKYPQFHTQLMDGDIAKDVVKTFVLKKE